jgi:hypothetical protein
MNQQIYHQTPDGDDTIAEDTGPRRRRRLVAAAVSVAVAGTVAVASAATLGGINAVSLGADQAEIASCESQGVTVESETAFDPAAASGRGAYVVQQVKVSDISRSCNGQTMSVTLAGASGTALAEMSTTLNAPGNPGNPNNPPNQAPIEVTLPVSPTPLAEDVARVAIVITG